MIDLNNDKHRESELNQALELLHFGFRALTAWPDQRLEELGYSRVHHRVLYFVGRNPDCSVSELLDILGVSKQYLHRPIRRLLDDGFLASRQDERDKRVKRLSLTAAGATLEAELSGDQRRRFQAVFEQVGAVGEAGWRQVMEALVASRFGDDH